MKQQLKIGQVVEINRGSRFKFIGDCFFNGKEYIGLDEYMEGLRHKTNKWLNIVAIYELDEYCRCHEVNSCKPMTLIWQQKNLSLRPLEAIAMTTLGKSREEVLFVIENRL